tara:strand:- start:3348 stop:3509 length:162 start_codon:yes stop_codon:yes gene_type:complete
MDWEETFKLLQVFNPESDVYLNKHKYHEENEEKATERWEYICEYMDTIKPEEE